MPVCVFESDRRLCEVDLAGIGAAATAAKTDWTASATEFVEVDFCTWSNPFRSFNHELVFEYDSLRGDDESHTFEFDRASSLAPFGVTPLVSSNTFKDKNQYVKLNRNDINLYSLAKNRE